MRHQFLCLTFALAALFACGAQAESLLTGTVTDASNAAIAGASVTLLRPGGTVIASAATDEGGAFSCSGVPAGTYHIRASADGFAARELAVTVGRGETLRIVLEPAAVYTRVTVSASRGAADDAASSPYVALVKDRAELAGRPLATIGTALEGEPGVLVQQTTYAQVSPFLRGMTGYHVLNLIDGVRFNNASFRSGPNQYLAFVDAGQAQRVEALLGPSGVQYGSDSLGGAINVITPESRFARQLHGDIGGLAASADGSGAGDARVSSGTERFAWLAGVAARRHGDLRAGGATDSRNVFYRLFGLPSEDVRRLLGGSQRDTGFSQYGAHGKLAARLRPDQILTVWYQHGEQSGVRNYKDLWGGLGRIESSFDPQRLDFFYVRHEKLGAGALDSVSGTFSVNSQSDGGTRQGLRATDAITRDRNRVDSLGYSAQATAHGGGRFFAAFGADVYDERVRSERWTGGPARPLYPDGASYQTFGGFGQGSAQLAGGRVRLGLGGRLTGVRFKTPEMPEFGVPRSSQTFRDATFNTSVSWQATGSFGVQGLVGRGFRAPNLNDLGALGLNDLGYEVPASEAAGALMGVDAGESAVSAGRAAGRLRPESLMNYELGVRFTARRLYARVQGFIAELSDPVVRRTLLYPAGAVPAELAGMPVSALPQTAAQREQGVVTVAVPLDPRAVKAFVNDGRSRYSGIESLARYAVSSRWSFEARYSILTGRELDPNRAMRRLPPQAGAVAVRYVPTGRRPWMEVSLAASGAQERLSGGDRDDERIGASRRRRDIADFFNGARVRPYLDAAGVFTPTGETLRQIQDRVLPLGATINGVRVVNDDSRVPLYTATAGWAAVNVRGGFPLGERTRLLFGVDNLLDRNYRVHGSGLDAPGRSAYVGLRYSF